MPGDQTGQLNTWDGGCAGMSGLAAYSCGSADQLSQFQYMALVHYGRIVRQASQELKQKLHAAEMAFSKERKQRRQLQTDLTNQQMRLERLDVLEKEIKQWQARKPKIFHYLGVFGTMMK